MKLFEGSMLDRRIFLCSTAIMGFGATAQQPERHFRLANGYKLDSFQTRNIADFAAALSACGITVELNAINTLSKLSDIPNAINTPSSFLW